MPDEPKTYKYFAFVSYSRKDSKAAAWLQRRLEWFRFPVKLVPEDRRPPKPPYVRPIYRDKTNLEVTDEHYWQNIRRALEESRFLIVLCSPHSAKSEPVNMEVEHFLKTHSGDAGLMVPVIVNGNVTSTGEDAALCPALSALGDTLINRNLPTMVPDAVTTEQDAWEAGFVSLVSYLLRLERTALGDHIQRETKRQATVLRRWLAAVILLTLCAIAGGIYSLVQKREAERQKAKQEALLLSASYADHEAASKAFEDKREAEGIAYFERALRYAPKNSGALVTSAHHAFGMNAPKWRARFLKTFGGSVRCVAFSPDGCYLAAGSVDKTARVIEAATGKEVSRAEFAYGVASVSFSPDGRYLAAGCGDNTARVIEAATGKVISKTEFGGHVTSLSFSPDGRYLAAGSWDDTARVIEAETGKEISRSEFGGHVTSLSFSPDGRYLAVGSMALIEGAVRVIEAETGKEISRAEFGGDVTSVRFSPAGRYLAVGSRGNTARVIEAATSKEISKVKFGNVVTEVSFSPDGRYLAASSEDETARVIEAATGTEISKVEFGSRVTSVSFSPDGRYLAVGSGSFGSGEARVIEAETGKEISKTEFGGDVISVSFSPDGRYLAAGSGDKTARVIEAVTGKAVSKAGFGDDVTRVSFSPDDRYLAAGSGSFGSGEARMIEAETGKEISKTEFGGCLSFSPDGRYLAADSFDNTARVIEAATGKEISKAEFGDRVTSVSFSPDGRYLAAGSWDDTARVIDARWQSTDTQITSPFTQALNLTSGLHFKPDGRLAPLTADELTQAQAHVTAFIQAPAPPDAKWQHAILTWAAMTPETRTTSPWTTEPLRVAAGRWFMQASGKVAFFITDTADEVPWHPLEPVSLARLEPKPDNKDYDVAQGTVRPTFLARLTLKRLRDADEMLYGRETLAEYAAWSAKIMHEELHLDAEAREALAFALERTPPEKQKELLELKVKLETK